MGVREQIARIGIGIALLIGFMASIATFFPGADTAWYIVGAGSASVGLLYPRWQGRFISIALVIGFVFLALAAYQRGIAYQEYLRQRGGAAGQGRQDVRRAETRCFTPDGTMNHKIVDSGSTVSRIESREMKVARVCFIKSDCAEKRSLLA